MIFHINENGDIIGASKENYNGIKQTFGEGIIDVIHDDLVSPQDYQYINEEFVLKDLVPVVGLSSTIFVDEVMNLNVPAGTLVEVNGVGFSEYGVSNDGNIEFSAERPGKYNLILNSYPYRETRITIEVVA